MVFKLPCSQGQYRESTPKFEEELAARSAALSEQLQDRANKLHPEHTFVSTSTYTYSSPRANDYAIGILLDPCKGNKYNCCMRAYGAPEYAMLKEPDTAQNRVTPKLVQASPGQVLSKVNLMDQDGVAIPEANSRFADDETIVDSTCAANDAPSAACVGPGQREQRSRLVPPCMDNNATVSGIAQCYDGTGNSSEHCVAVAISQTALSVVCGGALADDPHCGTFLEVHMAAPNEYVPVEATLAERRITARNITGYITTDISTMWQGNASKVLCAYELSDRLVGSMVLVTATAPRCCMPQELSPQTLMGSFMCPVYSKQRGPFAVAPVTVPQKLAFEAAVKVYPYCPYTAPAEDLCVISATSAKWNRRYTRPCAKVKAAAGGSGFTSSDLVGTYSAQCPYFDTAGKLAAGAACDADDTEFTFGGRVGRVVSVPADTSRGQFGVTFNDGRTVYYFNDEHLILELDYNYELWWVQRTRSKYIVQKRKPFTVTEPRCTFDRTNNQYYPFAVIDAAGNVID